MQSRYEVFPQSISVFFPAFNDAASLPGLLEKTFGVLRDHFNDYEAIVVNDGSSDSTAQVLVEQQRIHGARLRVVTHPDNRGYGGALRSGFAAATKEFVFYTDGDGQYDPRELVELFKKMRHGVVLVNGYKLERHDPPYRILVGNFYNRFAKALFGVGIRDIDCDFRLMRRDAVQSVNLVSTSGTICVELVRKLERCGGLVEEVGVHHYPRLHGRSQFFRVRSLLITFCQLVRLRLELSLASAVKSAKSTLAVWLFQS